MEEDSFDECGDDIEEENPLDDFDED